MHDNQVYGRISVKGHWVVECYSPEGALKWREENDNLIVTEGLNVMLNSTIKTGVTSPLWYIGLVGGTTTGVAAGDTMSSHGGWTEGTSYTEANRPPAQWGNVSAASLDNSAVKGTFACNEAKNIHGAFLVNNSTRGGATGTLFGMNTFAAHRSVINGDTLNVQVTVSLTST